jgi:hypothetical protein
MFSLVEPTRFSVMDYKVLDGAGFRGHRVDPAGDGCTLKELFVPGTCAFRTCRGARRA